MNVRWKVLKGLEKLGSNQSVIQDTHGNLSMRDDDNSCIFIKPSGVPYDKITLGNICMISMDGEQLVDNNKKPSVDTIHHLEIYRNCDWIKSICHTHSPYATAYAGQKLGITCSITEHADYFGGDIICTPYFDLNEWGMKVAEILNSTDRCNAILLGSHGVLTFGETAEKAVSNAIALENIAHKSFIMNALCRDTVPVLPKEEVVKWHSRYVNSYGQKRNDSDSE